MICNEEFEVKKVSDIDFYWNDRNERGLPICKGCIKILYKYQISWHLNYDRQIGKEYSMRGLDRFLK